MAGEYRRSCHPYLRTGQKPYQAESEQSVLVAIDAPGSFDCRKAAGLRRTMDLCGLVLLERIASRTAIRALQASTEGTSRNSDEEPGVLDDAATNFALGGLLLA